MDTFVEEEEQPGGLCTHHATSQHTTPCHGTSAFDVCWAVHAPRHATAHHAMLRHINHQCVIFMP